MKWIHGYNNGRLHGAVNCQTPNEKKDASYQQQIELEKAAQVLNKHSLENPGRFTGEACNKFLSLLAAEFFIWDSPHSLLRASRLMLWCRPRQFR